MRSVSGHARAVCQAGVSEVATRLRAVDRYPTWGGELVRDVIVLARDEAGRPEKVEATLHVQVGPIPLDLELTLEIEGGPRFVTLTRLANDPQDRERFVARWRLDEEEPGKTHIRLDIQAAIDVPRLVPLGDTADRLAKRFVEAAAEAADSAVGPPGLPG